MRAWIDSLRRLNDKLIVYATVESSTSTELYSVILLLDGSYNILRATCTCKATAYGRMCKHIKVARVLAKLYGGGAS